MQELILSARRLSHAWMKALHQRGHCHEIVRGGQIVKTPISVDGVFYDSKSNLVWAEISTERFPEDFNIEDLNDQQFHKRLTQHFGSPVLVRRKGSKVLIMSVIKSTSARVAG